MHLDAVLPPVPLSQMLPMATAAEDMGFGTAWIAETQHNPFLPGALIAQHTERMHFGTAIAVSFARSPTTLAHTAWDLAEASRGRFILGLGTQVKPHIERRFGMPWPDSPVGKLREQIVAIRALWRCWQTGERLNLRGKYYKLTLMSPFFNPGPIDYPDIPIYIAGVNTGLARLAGETADGFHAHPLHTTRYLTEVVLPAIQQGAARAGRERSACQISTSVFVITNPEEREFVRQQISFYASTPSYRRVFALHGWEEIARQLSSFAARKKWDAMPALITDEMLAELAVVSPAANLAAVLRQRYAGLSDRLTIYMPFLPGERDAFWRGLLADWAAQSI